MKKRISDIFNLMILLAIVFTIWFLLKVVDYAPAESSEFSVDIPDAYPVLGMDVSHHQGEIDWEKVSAVKEGDDSIQFVFIKATEGLQLEDEKKRANAVGARSVGIDYGFYHYFIPSKSAKKQADFFCDETGGYNYDLRPVVDVEAKFEISSKQLMDSVQLFLDRVEYRLGVRPLVYTYADYYKANFKLMQEDYWIAHYNRKSTYLDSTQVLCWQFSERGNVNGVSTAVDLNIAKSNFFRKVGR